MIFKAPIFLALASKYKKNWTWGRCMFIGVTTACNFFPSSLRKYIKVYFYPISKKYLDLLRSGRELATKLDL